MIDVPSNEHLLEMYRKMLLMRKFDETVGDLFASGKLPGFVHLYIGEEAVAAGVSAALRMDDYITSTHRGHGHCIARGADVRRMMAELYGKRTGYCKGKGGSMHLFDIGLGILGANGIVGAGGPLAAGAGLTIKLRRTDQVVACFFGDGGTNQGAFHESLNLSAIWRLPVLWVCENNLYAEATPIWAALKVQDVSTMAGSYDIPGRTVDGNDVLEVYRTAKEAVDRARKGEGPTLIECKTYRQRGHFEGDPVIYRTREEEKEWLKRDPIPRFESKLLESGVATKDQMTSIRSEVTRVVADAVKFAEESPLPEPGEAFEDVFVSEQRSHS